MGGTNDGMGMREVRERCEALVARIHIPDPFDLDTFVAHLGVDRGRPVVLLAIALPRGAACGYLLATDTADYVVINDAARGPQRVHFALHEVSHLLLRHPMLALTDPEASRLMLPHLDPAVVRAMFARTTYDTVFEQEAEVTASLLGQRAGLWRPVPAEPAGPAADPLVKRIGRSLEHG